jgi:protein TonB
MLRKILLTLYVLVIIGEIGYSQTKKIKIVDQNLKKTYEEFHVLKSNKDIREGTYKHIICNKLSVDGTYKNGEKTGVWKCYNYEDEVELEINYDNGLIKYLTIDSITKKDVILETSLNPSGDRPMLIISGSNIITNYLIHHINYPQYALERGISGKVVIELILDSKGKISDYVVNTSIDKSLDDEALRVVRMIPMNFLPVFINGEAAETKLMIPVNFVLK